jgi:hypothetical protein
MKDIHSRMDSIEARQTQIENNQSKNNGAMSALSGLAKDFALPAMAIVVTWFVAKNEAAKTQMPPMPERPPLHSAHPGYTR